MAKKLTLTLNEKIIEKAKIYSRKNNISLSKLVEFYFKTLSASIDSDDAQIPPITKELSGIAKINTPLKSEKEMLAEALNKKYL